MAKAVSDKYSLNVSDVGVRLTFIVKHGNSGGRCPLLMNIKCVTKKTGRIWMWSPGLLKGNFDDIKLDSLSGGKWLWLSGGYVLKTSLQTGVKGIVQEGKWWLVPVNQG